jgi:hypothetical protein
LTTSVDQAFDDRQCIAYQQHRQFGISFQGSLVFQLLRCCGEFRGRALVVSFFHFPLFCCKPPNPSSAAATFETVATRKISETVATATHFERAARCLFTAAPVPLALKLFPTQSTPALRQTSHAPATTTTFNTAAAWCPSTSKSFRSATSQVLPTTTWRLPTACSTTTILRSPAAFMTTSTYGWTPGPPASPASPNTC